MDDERVAADRVVHLLEGHIRTQLVTTAVALRIPDAVVQRPLSAAELAEQVDADPGLMQRFLRALDQLGVVEERADGRFESTGLTALLAGDAALAGYARLVTNVYRDSWAALPRMLQTGKPGVTEAFGTDLWTYLAAHPADTEAFNRMMGWNSERVVDDLVPFLRAPDMGCLVDLGAGDGSLTMAVLATKPRLRAVLVEQQEVVRETVVAVAARGFTDRCQVIGGDLTRHVHPDGDLYLLKSVLHNWSDADAHRILCNTAAAMTSDARLAVVERPATGRGGRGVNDLMMAVLFGGSDRTEQQYRDLLCGAGLRVTDVGTAPSGFQVFEAVRA